MKHQTQLSNLCNQVCEEFKKLGFQKDIDSSTLKESFNIIKQANGNWYKTTKLGLHDSPILVQLNLTLMPFTTKMTSLINELDADFNKKGGRIFITENLVSKIKKGTETPIIIESKTNAIPIYQKLCEEIIEHGLEKDRYRSEETYMLTKSTNGEWSMSSSHENHSGQKKILDLSKMPQLKRLSLKINKLDSKFNINGGRIFITPFRIYRINNKVEINFKF